MNRRFRAPFLLLSALVTLGAAGCKGKIKPEECTRMMDRYVDMVIAIDPATQNLPPNQAAAVREMKKAVKRAEPSYAQVQTQCETEVTRREYDCAMDSKSPEEWEGCIE